MKPVRDIYEDQYFGYNLSDWGRSNKYEWAASNVFNLATYDEDLDERFVKKIIEVCKVILEKRNFQYIEESEQNYVDYILVCQLLNQMDWIDWGSSIRGAWFCDYNKPREILFVSDNNSVPFTEENLKTLIDFVEEEE